MLLRLNLPNHPVAVVFDYVQYIQTCTIILGSAIFMCACIIFLLTPALINLQTLLPQFVRLIITAICTVDTCRTSRSTLYWSSE